MRYVFSACYALVSPELHLGRLLPHPEEGLRLHYLASMCSLSCVLPGGPHPWLCVLGNLQSGVQGAVDTFC